MNKYNILIIIVGIYIGVNCEPITPTIVNNILCIFYIINYLLDL